MITIITKRRLEELEGIERSSNQMIFRSATKFADLNAW